MLRKILFGATAVLAILLAAAIVLPLLFKDELAQAVKDQVNATINATVDFGEVDVSLFRNFPDFSVGLENISVTGQQEFDGVQLLRADQLDVSLDFWSVISSATPLTVSGLYLESPDVHIYILDNGKANYDITKPDTTSASSEESNFLVRLEKYSLQNGNLKYEDNTQHLTLIAKNLNHSGSGDLTASTFDLNTKTTAEQLSAIYGGIPYLSEVRADLEAIIQADMDAMKFTLKDNKLIVNALSVFAEGWIQLNENDTDMDLSLQAPSNDFREIMSIIPGIYTDGYDDADASGTFKFAADIKGKYSPSPERYPAFNIDLTVSQGNLKYPDMPIGITNVNAQAAVKSPSADLNDLVVNIPNFSMNMGDQPFEGRFRLQTPISNPDVDARLKGTIDLATLPKVIPMDMVSELSGIIKADMTLKATMNDMEAGRYQDVNAQGYMQATDLRYVARDMPAVSIRQFDSRLSPAQLNIEKFDLSLGNSDLKGSGKVDNYLAYFSPEQTMRGRVKIHSDLIDLNEWMPEPVTESPMATPVSDSELFERFVFSLDATANLIKYDAYDLKNTTVSGSFAPEKIEMKSFSTEIGSSDLSGNGILKNVFGYVFDNETLHGQINLKSKRLNLNELMAAEASQASTTEPSTPYLIPENVEVSINAHVGTIDYTNMQMRNLKGQIQIADQAVSMDDVETESLGGTMALSGSYNTADPEAPKFNLKHKMLKVNFGETFRTLTSFKQLAPIAEYMTGNFNTEINLAGVLKEDMTPDISTITAAGFLETINAILNNFKPLEKVGNLLNINEIKNIKGIDVKAFFEVKDGKVEVKEFPMNYQNIAMKVSGTHGLNQEMDYLLKLKIPRNLLDKTGATSAANTGLDLLSKQASKLGLNLDAGKFVNVSINLTGNIKSPKVAINLLGTDGQPVNVVEDVKEEVKKTVDEKVDEVKEEVQQNLDEEKAKLKEKAQKEINAILDKANNAAEKVRTEAGVLAKKVRNEGYAQADKLEKSAGDNPLKKIAAQKGAEKLRKETDQKADNIIAEGNNKADVILQTAQQKANAIRTKYGLDEN